MDTKDVKTVAMYGPSISEPSKVVNRDVPVCDVQAYKAAGYVLGSIEVKPEIHPVVIHNLEDKPKGRGKK
jgi:hypothetical protein